MRDNLLFFGIPESVSKPLDAGAFGAMGGATGGPDDVIGGAMSGPAPMEGLTNGDKTDGVTPTSFAKVVETGENCAEKVFDFCEKVLNIENPQSKIQIAGSWWICLYIRKDICDGLTVMDNIPGGFLWVKMDTNYFSLQDDLYYICFIIISIFKEDNVFSITASLPYGPPVNTDIGYYQTFLGLVNFCNCCQVSCAIFC